MKLPGYLKRMTAVYLDVVVRKHKKNSKFDTHFEGELTGSRNLRLRLWEKKFVNVITQHKLNKSNVSAQFLNFYIFLTAKHFNLNLSFSIT